MAVHVCPAYCTHPESHREVRSLVEELFPPVSVLGSLGCKAWGEVMLTYYAEERGFRLAGRVLDLLHGDRDDVLSAFELLAEDDTIEAVSVGIELARALHVETEVDRRLRPVFAEEYGVLPEPCGFTVEDLVDTYELEYARERIEEVKRLLGEL